MIAASARETSARAEGRRSSAKEAFGAGLDRGRSPDEAIVVIMNWKRRQQGEPCGLFVDDRFQAQIASMESSSTT